MRTNCRKTYVSAALALLLLLISAGSAGAVIRYFVTADATDMTMPDGTIVPAWGFAVTRIVDDGTVLLNDPGAAVKVPGDPIIVPIDETTLVIRLTNNLPEATSLNILGLQQTNRGAPQYLTEATDLRKPRVLSFGKHVLTGETRNYRWDNFRAGTYMVQSATNPAKQVQMGLFAAVVKDSGPGEAYPGLVYDEQRILVLHEVDAAMQEAIATGDYGPGTMVPSSVHRKPRYYLINGSAYPETSLADVTAGTATLPNRVLLRFINAGLETHVPQILGKYLTLVAQDGYRRSYDQEAYGFELNAAATMDAILEVTEPPGAHYPIYDGRVKHLSNYGDGPGGMMVHLNVAAPAVN